MENIEEYATLKALGASQAFVARIVLTQALILWGQSAAFWGCWQSFQALATQNL